MLNCNYLKQFWVGLIDGDGSIQVNHWRNKYLQYRIIIKLKFTNNNEILLNKISKVIGGYVRITNNGKFIIWVVNDRQEIIRIIKIFNKYPLLTSRKICQLDFLKECLNHNNVDIYLNTRNFKYSKQSIIIKSNPLKHISNSNYFKIWLSGFTEAEGCFSLRKNNNNSFSISQKYDRYILESIKTYFKASNKVRILSNDFYILEIYKKEKLQDIFLHYKKYPLIGEKLISFNKFFIN